MFQTTNQKSIDTSPIFSDLLRSSHAPQEEPPGFPRASTRRRASWQAAPSPPFGWFMASKSWGNILGLIAFVQFYGSFIATAIVVVSVTFFLFVWCLEDVDTHMWQALIMFAVESWKRWTVSLLDLENRVESGKPPAVSTSRLIATFTPRNISFGFAPSHPPTIWITTASNKSWYRPKKGWPSGEHILLNSRKLDLDTWVYLVFKSYFHSKPITIIIFHKSSHFPDISTMSRWVSP